MYDFADNLSILNNDTSFVLNLNSFYFYQEKVFT